MISTPVLNAVHPRRKDKIQLCLAYRSKNPPRLLLDQTQIQRRTFKHCKFCPRLRIGSVRIVYVGIIENAIHPCFFYFRYLNVTPLSIYRYLNVKQTTQNNHILIERLINNR